MQNRDYSKPAFRTFVYTALIGPLIGTIIVLLALSIASLGSSEGISINITEIFKALRGIFFFIVFGYIFGLPFSVITGLLSSLCVWRTGGLKLYQLLLNVLGATVLIIVIATLVSCRGAYFDFYSCFWKLVKGGEVFTFGGISLLSALIGWGFFRKMKIFPSQ